MNGAKIRLSPEPDGGNGPADPGIYHNIKRPVAGGVGDINDAAPGWDLSPEERALVEDEALILAKNRVMGKTVAFFAGLSEEMKVRAPAAGAATVTSGSGFASGGMPQLWDNAPKISRGENYKGFPWVVLDYPRCFGREDVFAVRTLFWWGHYFSVTLHLKGSYKTLLLPAVRSQIPSLTAAGFHICVSDDEWRHELAADNYVSLSTLSSDELEAVLSRPGFLKFSAMVGLGNSGSLVEDLLHLYDAVIGLLV